MDNSTPHPTGSITTAFSQHIHDAGFPLKNTDADSVLAFLYTAYAEVQGRDPVEIQQGFIDLDKMLDCVSLDVNNTIFEIVCRLCTAYEQRAFIDGIRIGAYLIEELKA